MSIFKLRAAVWFTLVTSGYLYVAGAVALGWWPVGTPVDPEVGIWFYCWAAGRRLLGQGGAHRALPASSPS